MRRGCVNIQLMAHVTRPTELVYKEGTRVLSEACLMGSFCANAAS